MLDLTVIILTKNEQKNIAGVIKNAKQCAGDVLIIDSGSTDDTVKLARENGARVAYRAWDDDFSAQRNFALTQTDKKYVLYLDADERFNDELISAIKTAAGDKQYIMKRKSIAFGQEFNHGVLRPDFVARLFPADKVKWVNKVHEIPLCDLPKENLNGCIKHYTYTNWDQYFNKLNQYTTIWAQNAHNNGKKSGVLKAFFRAVFGSFQMLVLRKGFLDGKYGFVLSVNHFFYVWGKYTKLWQLGDKK